MKNEKISRPRSFYGWRILGLATVTGGLSGPGQTIGVSVFVDQFIADLGMSRSGVSTAYLIGTLIAALGLPRIGQQIDRAGVRRAMTAIGIAFGIALVAMAGVQGFVTLTIGFVAIRLFGQGSLMLASTVSVTLWFDKRRGTVLGIFSTGTAILMAFVPVGLSLVIESFGWRIAWVVAGVLIWLVVVPIARYGMIDRPSDVGQVPDGPNPKRTRPPKEHEGDDATRREALRTYRFWILLSSTATVGMLSTALNFHQISLLTDAGLTSTEAAVMFLPQVIGAGAAGLLFGFLSDRLTGRWLIPMGMGLLAISLLAAANLTPGLAVVLYAVSLGAAGGATRSISATLLPRWFGVRHIGEIQGTASFVNVASTALGPVAFALARTASGGYSGAATWFIILPLIAGVAATTIRPIPPSGRTPDHSDG